MRKLGLFLAVAAVLFAPVAAIAQSVGTYTEDNGAVRNRIGTAAVTVPSADTTLAVAPSATSAVAASLVLKASAGNLYSLNLTTGATAGYVLIFNLTSNPADGAVTPVKCLPVSANSGIAWSWRDMPLAMSTGITVVFSTTGCYTKTESATAFISGEAK